MSTKDPLEILQPLAQLAAKQINAECLVILARKQGKTLVVAEGDNWQPLILRVGAALLSQTADTQDA
jgi:hypothetical protein